MNVMAVNINTKGLVAQIGNTKDLSAQYSSISSSSIGISQNSSKNIAFAAALPYGERVSGDAKKILDKLSLMNKVENFTKDADENSGLKMSVAITAGFADLLVIAPLSYAASAIKNLFE